MCKNGEFEIEVKTTATPEITTTMFDGDWTDQKDYTMQCIRLLPLGRTVTLYSQLFSFNTITDSLQGDP
jgi:hypothetical protein